MGGGVGAKIDLFFSRRGGEGSDPKVAKTGFGIYCPRLRVWWTSTDDKEEKTDMNVITGGGSFRFPLKEKLKILGCVMNRQSKTLDAIEERMQSANKAS